MSELIAYGHEVDNVFQLIGFLENDITKSIAWGLVKCPVFLKRILDSMLGIDVEQDKVVITYQQFEKGKGITDLEITDKDDSFYVIVEAKRGWNLPQSKQLTEYSERNGISKSKAKYKAIITMSECSENYADLYLPFKEVNGIPVMHLSWKRIYNIAKESKKGSGNKEKSILDELIRYLGGIMTTQNIDSNWVFVVSLSPDKAGGSELSYIDVVNKKNKYFHPVGNRWPDYPVNYIAFRYRGQLQSIHHVEDYVISRNLHEQIPEFVSEEWEPHYVYNLGPAIVPNKTVKGGPSVHRANRVWAMLDTLLTADTITEAMEMTRERTEKREG